VSAIAVTRTAPLTAGDFAKVEAIEEQIGTSVTRQLHLKERITLLRRLLDERRLADRNAQLDAVAEQARERRTAAVRIITTAYPVLARKLATLLSELQDAEQAIEAANAQLGAAGREEIEAANVVRLRMLDGTADLPYPLDECVSLPSAEPGTDATPIWQRRDRAAEAAAYFAGFPRLRGQRVVAQ
jgi:hypothetical protein